MRTLAIGDIHGCLTALETLLQRVAPLLDDTIVTLGDYVSRGPDSAGVLNRLIELSTTHQLVPILGNHEQMLLEARGDADHLALYLNCGGEATLRSYSPFPDFPARVGDIPDEHWDFLADCREYYETATHLFVHAGLYPELPLTEQPAYMLRWETFNDPPPHESGKVMVCGHTSQPSGFPRNIGHAICIDTHAHARRGWLTCLDTTSGRVYQANERGETRQSWIDEYLEE